MARVFQSLGFAIFYNDKYFKLIWNLEKSSGNLFTRKNINLTSSGTKKTDIYYGFNCFREDFEVDIFLLCNRGVQGNNLLNLKPQPELLLFCKGEDPGDYLNSLAFTIKKIENVKAVVPFDFSKSLAFRTLTFEIN